MMRLPTFGAATTPLLLLALGAPPSPASAASSPGPCLGPGDLPDTSAAASCESSFPSTTCTSGVFSNTCPTFQSYCRGRCGDGCSCRSSLSGCAGVFSGGSCVFDLACVPSPLPRCAEGYLAFDTGGCAGRNELGEYDGSTVEECAAGCDADPSCVSFEFEKFGSTCHLSSSCDRLSLTAQDDDDSYFWYVKEASLATDAPTEVPTASPTITAFPTNARIDLDISDECLVDFERLDVSGALLDAVRGCRPGVTYGHPDIMLVQEMVCPVSSPAFEVACAAGGGTVKYFASDLFRCNDGIIGVMWRGYPSCVPASCTEDEALKFDGLLQKFLLSSPLYGYGDCAVVTDCEVGRPDNLGDGECDGNAYNTRPCEFDRGDCLVQNARYPLCNPRYPEWVGDGKCHSKDYNIEECGYDGGDCLDFNEKYPDCEANNPSWLGDGTCHGGAYNTEECGYDGGDCFAFNEAYPGCDVTFPSSVGDGKCNSKDYNTEACGFDGGDCQALNGILEKYPDCEISKPMLLGNGECDGGEYNTPKCGYDGSDCLVFNEKYPDCKISRPMLLGNGECDGGEYNTPECGYDGSDCLVFNEMYPDCEISKPKWLGDGECEGGEYNTPECGYDGSDCLVFNEKYPDCTVDDPYYLGDGECDGDEYNSEACGFDGGDCLEKQTENPTSSPVQMALSVTVPMSPPTTSPTRSKSPTPCTTIKCAAAVIAGFRTPTVSPVEGLVTTPIPSSANPTMANLFGPAPIEIDVTQSGSPTLPPLLQSPAPVPGPDSLTLTSGPSMDPTSTESTSSPTGVATAAESTLVMIDATTPDDLVDGKNTPGPSKSPPDGVVEPSVTSGSPTPALPVAPIRPDTATDSGAPTKSPVAKTSGSSPVPDAGVDDKTSSDDAGLALGNDQGALSDSSSASSHFYTKRHQYILLGFAVQILAQVRL